MKDNINISIIVPCYNGEKYIKGCLDSILKSKYDDYEIIIIDDCSTDSSQHILETYKNNNHISSYLFDENKGPAVARNFGVNKSNSQIVLFLDIDTKVDVNCLAEIKKTFKTNKKLGAVQTKLLFSNTNNIDTAGHFLSRLGFPYEIGVGENETKHTVIKEIFGARTAGMAVRKNVFDMIGGFDEDYLIYGEDTDLSWRIWLSGYTILYVPTAIVYHYSKSSLNEKTINRVFYQGAKNNTGNILKNGSLKTIIWLLPLHLLGWIVICIKLLVQGRLTSAWAIIRGSIWNMIHINWVLYKRNNVSKYIDKKSKATSIIWGPATLFTIISKGRNWYKNV